jgi:hypothetical protein
MRGDGAFWRLNRAFSESFATADAIENDPSKAEELMSHYTSSPWQKSRLPHTRAMKKARSLLRT